LGTWLGLSGGFDQGAGGSFLAALRAGGGAASAGVIDDQIGRIAITALTATATLENSCFIAIKGELNTNRQMHDE
jgi:hypothetical protein